MNALTVQRLLRGFVPVAAAAALLLPVAAQAQEASADAEEPEVSSGVEVDFNSQYVWRGIAFSDDVVMQPYAWYTDKDTTYSIWANYPLAHEANQGQFNEVDLTISHKTERKGFTLEPALGIWTYPNQKGVNSTAEASVRISHPVGPFKAYTFQSMDLAAVSGGYYGEAGLSLDHQATSKVACQTSLSVGWANPRFNQGYLDTHKWAVNVASAQLCLSCDLGHGWYVRPHVGYTHLIDKTLRRQVKEPGILTAGVAVGVSF